MNHARERQGPPPDLAALCAIDVMQRDLVTVHAGDPLREVERVLAEAQVSGVPVLDDNDHVIGVVSTTDLVSRRADDEGPERTDYRDVDEDDDETEVVAYRRAVVHEPCAGDLMTPDVASVAPLASLREVAHQMVDRQVHRLLVVDQGRLVGLVSTMDVLRAIAR